MNYSPEDGGGGGGGEPTFLETLPEDIRGEASLSSFQDAGSLAKSYVNAQRMLGSRVAIPGEGATDEERNGFYNRLGRPEAADGYSLPNDVQLRDGMEWDPELVKAANGEFHKLGLTQAQAQGVMRYYVGTLNNRAEGEETTRTQAMEASVASLKEEWGDSYESNVNAAKEALGKFGSDELKALVADSGLGNNQHFIKMLHSISVGMGEDTGNRGATGGGEGLTPEQAAFRINDIKKDTVGDTDWARYWRDDKSLGVVKRDELNKEFSRLHKIADPYYRAQGLVSPE